MKKDTKQTQKIIVCQNSKESLIKSYYLPQPKNARREGLVPHNGKSHQHRNSSVNSNFFNNTCEIDSPRLRHLKKKSTFSSTACSKHETVGLYRI